MWYIQVMSFMMWKAFRTHACAAGAPQNQLKQPQNQALGHSVGGLSTKIHIMTDGLGNPLNFTLLLI